MAEQIILDPSEVATGGRTALDLTPWIAAAGPDYGDAALVTYLSEQSVGSSPVDYRVPNRQITIPLSIRDLGGTTFAQARSAIQTKIGQWQNSGGWLKRVTGSGGTVFCDVVSAQLRLSGDFLQARAQSPADINASITLEAIPDFYGAEETLSDHTETTATVLSFTETTNTGGDFPLGDRVRIVVDEDQALSQRGLIGGFRCRNHSSAATASFTYEAEALQPLDTAAKVAKVGASGGTVVTHGTLSTNWTPVLGTNIGGTTYLTHQGTYRAWARVFTTSGTAVQARLVYDVGDLVYPTENPAVRCYDGGTFHVLNLGEVRLEQPPNSAGYRWQGIIQAAGNSGGENFSVDQLWFQPIDESAWVARAPVNFGIGGGSYSARTEFNTESGALNGDSLDGGGTWTTAGVATDFSAAAGVITRTTSSEASPRFAYPSGIASTATDQVVAVDVKWSGLAGAFLGVFARYVDTSNYFYAALSPSGQNWVVAKRIAGVLTTILSGPAVGYTSGIAYRVQLGVSASGYWSLQVAGITVASGTDTDLMPSATLDDGRAGIFDTNSDSTGITRTYDHFAAWVPTNDAVIYASRSAELNTLGITRQDTGGTAYGPVSQVNGDLPRIPNRAAGGTVGVFLKASRGDLQTINDAGIDDISARVYRRASYLLVP